MYSSLTTILRELDCIFYEASLDNGLWINRSEGVCIECLTGIPCENFISKKVSWFDVIHQEDREKVLDDVSLDAVYPRSLSHTYRVLNKDSDAVTWVKDIKNIKFKSNKVSITGMIVNVTDSKEIELRNEQLLKDLYIKNNHIKKISKTLKSFEEVSSVSDNLFAENAFIKIEKDVFPLLNELRQSGSRAVVDSIKELLKNIFTHPEKISSLDRLSNRELEVLSFVQDGLTQPLIASELGLSVDTVKTHVKNIKKKLNIPKESSLFSATK